MFNYYFSLGCDHRSPRTSTSVVWQSCNDGMVDLFVAEEGVRNMGIYCIGLPWIQTELFIKISRLVYLICFNLGCLYIKPQRLASLSK